MENIPRPWISPELNRLKTLYPNTPMDELVRALNRSSASILGKAKELKLKRSAEFLAGEHSGRFGSGNQRGLKTRFQKSLKA